MTTGPSAAPSDLPDRARRAVRSTALGTLATNGVQIAQVVVLAALLEPRDIGLVGMATVAAGFLSIFTDAGVGASAIQRASNTRETLTSLWAFNVVVAAALAVLLVLAAPVLELFFGQPELDEILVPLAAGMVITGLGQQSGFVLERELRFTAIARIEALAAVLGLGVAVSAALAGWGAAAIAAGIVAGATLRSIGVVVAAWPLWRPGRGARPRLVKEHLSFGLASTGQRAVNYLSSNADFLVVGSLFQAQALGHYTLAYNLANVPSSRINAIASRVFFPVFARLKDDGTRLRAGYLRLQGMSLFVNAPILLLLLFGAPTVPDLLGERWGPSVPLLQVLCLVGLTRCIAGTIGPLLLALRRADLGLRWSLLVALLQAPAVYIGGRAGGPLGVAVAFAAVQALLLVANYRFLVRTLVGPCLGDYVRSMAPTAAVAAATAVPLAAVTLLGDHLPPLALLAVEGAVLVVSYGLLSRRFNPRAVHEARSVLRGPGGTS